MQTAPNVYECMFILDTTKVAGDVAAADKVLRIFSSANHAEVLVSRPWDERRLAYPIKNQKKGLYYLTYISTEGKNVVGIEKDMRSHGNDSANDGHSHRSQAGRDNAVGRQGRACGGLA